MLYRFWDIATKTPEIAAVSTDQSRLKPSQGCFLQWTTEWNLVANNRKKSTTFVELFYFIEQNEEVLFEPLRFFNFIQ